MDILFPNRREAGRLLAEELSYFATRPDVIVLALPRGGVPVAFEIATKLGVPLDIFLVRKLAVPGYAELAMGAIASGGGRILNERLIRSLGISRHLIDSITSLEKLELERQETKYRESRPPVDCRGSTVILVDDGLATGASMRVAVQALKLRGPAHIVVAVPVGSQETCQQMQTEADEVICGKSPEDFGSVGAFYEDFSQVTDEEVCDLLSQAQASPVGNHA